ncbi:MAG: hypothetical protein MJ252_16135 [archaeon]|nr:hypothetical protein [archaeon]
MHKNMNEHIVQSSTSKNGNKIIIFGPEGSWKSSILNSLSNYNSFPINDISNYAEINPSKNFVKKKVLIEESQYELYDTIGIVPSYKINDLETKLEKFKRMIINQRFCLVLITFPLSNGLNFDYNSFILFMNTFSFSNNKNVFIVLTKGEQIETEEGRDECYDSFKEELKNKVRNEKIQFNHHNVIIYDSNKLEEFRREILYKASDENRGSTQIEIKIDVNKGENIEIGRDMKILNKLYTCTKGNENIKIEKKGIGILGFIKNILDNCAFLNSPNMII